MKNIAQALLNEATLKGSVDLSVIGCSGSFLNSQEDLMSEDWYKDEEQRGDFDATQHKFWITTDNGMSPDGYDNAEQLVDFLENFRSNMPNF